MLLWLSRLRPPGLVLLAEGIYERNLAMSLFHIASKRKKIFFCADICLKTLEVDQELFF
jgi:hypothetical protein